MTIPTPAMVKDIDLSRQVRRMRIVRLMDYGLVFMSIQVMLQSLMSLVFDENDITGYLVHLAFIGAASACFWIGLRNIGSISSRTWTSYLWMLGLLLPTSIALVVLMSSMGASDPASVLSTMTWAFVAVWCVVTLIALLGLRSMKPSGIDVNLRTLARSMADDGRVASTPIDFSQIKRVNLGKGIAFGALGCVVLLASAYGYHVAAPNFNESAKQVQDVGKFFTLVDCIGFFLLVRMRRYFQVDADALLRVDRRPPILFLRSFEDDEKLTFAQSGEALFDYSLETRLSRHFVHFGPFVAIGAPSEELPMPGAARIRLSDADWQAQVRRWMSSAQVILMYCGNTFWVNWELAMLARKGYLHKVIVLFPPRRGWAQRTKKLIDDIQKRLAGVRAALRDTRWADAAAVLLPEKDLRALLFHPDGTLTAVRSKREDRDAYHLAVLVGHYILGGVTVQAVLCLRNASGRWDRWPIHPGTMHIGAGRQNDIALGDDGFVSAEHARIDCTGTNLAIVDLGSRNGTYVNGAVLRDGARTVRPGDEIRIGHSVFEVRTS
ncbi:FHA domain-containing protein [Variovorax sp. J22R115]|uniref:FHA domain-containing protein n=1 Tax=Variovorax sp. J22R115 TaxID=3053509 RepID=UPI0025764BC3|nr:FHA domain-containing protein [Variovorax sp. J22R115]MDM0047927.1 FHA domain-containing protein [Variovorax sp. J22R115]